MNKIVNLFVVAFVLFISSCKSGPSDQEIQNQVTGALSSAPGVSATVNDGVVTLAGTCPDDPCKTNSESSAKNIKGVKSVVNNITVTPPPAPPQVEITPNDSLTTAVNSLVSSYKTVNATVNDGVVTLTGTIKRSQLTTLMQSVNELKPKKVVNQLEIK